MYKEPVLSMSQPGDQGHRQSLHGPPLSSGVGGGEVRGVILPSVSAGIAGTTSVEAVKEKLSRDVQKPPVGWDKNMYT